MSKIINSPSQIIHNFRQEMKDGKQFLVVPGVPVKEGVLNKRLVPADEIGHFVGSWNGIPLTLRHPKLNDGSANVHNPDVPILGRFYNAAFDGKKLTGEYWFEDQLLQIHDPVMRNKIIAGEGIENSSAYYSDDEEVSGVFEGKDYEMISRNLVPNHIAVLPDEIGACSMQDGCGVNRNSSQSSCPMGAKCPMYENKKGVSMNIQDFIKSLSGKGIKVKVNEQAGQDPSYELDETPVAPVPQPAASPFTAEELAALKALAASAPVLQNAAQFAQNAAEEAKQRKAGLVASIKTNSANPFGDTELEGMTETALMKLNAHLNTNFMALSGVNQNADESNIAVAPDTFTWASATVGGK